MSILDLFSALLHIATLCIDISTILFLINLEILIKILQVINHLLKLVFLNEGRIELLIQILIQDSNNILKYPKQLTILHQFFWDFPYTLYHPVIPVEKYELSTSKLTLYLMSCHSTFLMGVISFFLFLFISWVLVKFRFDIILLWVIILKIYVDMGLMVQQYLIHGFALAGLAYILFFFYYIILLFLFVSMILLFFYILWKIDAMVHSTISALFYFYFFLHICYNIFGYLLICTNFNLIIFSFSVVFFISMIIWFCKKYL